MRTFNTIGEIREFARDHGSHFFDSDTMRFFRSRVLRTVFGGRYFVTSEQFVMRAYAGPRRYTVRAVTSDGNVTTIGEFQAYATARDAAKAARALARGADGAAHA